MVTTLLRICKTNKDIVIAYLDCFVTGDTDGMEPLSANNLQFQGPFHFYNSSTEHLENLRRNPPQRSEYELLSLSEGDNRIAVFYNYRKPDRTMLLAQLFILKKQKIMEILFVFDGRSFSTPYPFSSKV